MSAHHIETAPLIAAADRIYSNPGNVDITALLDPECQSLLDVGCGAGDNARLIKAKYPACRVFGITHSTSEMELAKAQMDECWVFDIEDELPAILTTISYDTLLFSHVLEHLREPANVLRQFSELLNPGGVVLIAVPNVLSWRQRIMFLFGTFKYESAGVLDDTHLRFFTYFTADEYLLAKSPMLRVICKGVTASFPLWIFRRFLLPNSWCERIDTWAAKHWPNLFGAQILIKAMKVDNQGSS